MDRSTRIVWAARWLLLAAGLLCAFGMLGPYRGLERAFVPWDKAAHFMAGYGLTLLMFAGFPQRRRLDLVIAAICAGAAGEVMQSAVGRDGQMGDLVGDALGAIAVYAPIWLERLRQPRIERRASQAAPTQAATARVRSA
jgi:VanZ family protein